MLGGARYALPTFARGGLGKTVRCGRDASKKVCSGPGHSRRSNGSLTRNVLSSTSRNHSSSLLPCAQSLSRPILQCLARGTRNALRFQFGNVKYCEKVTLLRSLAGPAALLLPAKKHVDDRVDDIPLQLVDVHGVIREEWKNFDYLQQSRCALSACMYLSCPLFLSFYFSLRK